MYMLYVVGRVVYGVTYLDNIMYVVCYMSSTIRLYNTDTLSPLDVVINVTGMKHPHDIVVCRHDRQLYVADWYRIWRVSVDDHSYVKWLPQSSTDRFHVNRLSMTSQHLVTSWHPPSVRQYSTTNKERLCVVHLSQYMKELYNAVETTHNTFVISHQGTSQDKFQCAVSELFRFYHVLQLSQNFFRPSAAQGAVALDICQLESMEISHRAT